MMTPKQIRKATKIWERTVKYLDQFGYSPHEVQYGEDFRHQCVEIGDQVILATGPGRMRSGVIWKIMGFGKGGRSYFIFVPELGRVISRASSYIVRDISD